MSAGKGGIKPGFRKDSAISNIDIVMKEYSSGLPIRVCVCAIGQSVSCGGVGLLVADY
jgi:hypothetical protein